MDKQLNYPPSILLRDEWDKMGAIKKK